MTREVFIENVRREQEGLRRFLLALCGGDRQMSDDLAQDTLVKAYIASDEFVPRYKFSTWLYRIGYNCFIDYTRRKSMDTVSETAARNAESDISSDGSFQYQDLYDAIGGLSYPEKVAILLFYMEDRPVKEISHIMNLPEGTVRSHLSRGREHLRKRIER